MKLLFDQNISHRILSLISGKYIGSSSVKKEGLINAFDEEIWEFSRSNNYIIVTQDSDFNDLNSLYGFPPKIIWIRTGNLKTQTIATIINDSFEEVLKFSKNNSYGCFEILSLKTQ